MDALRRLRGVGFVLRQSPMRRRTALALTFILTAPLAFAPQTATAGFFDFLFGANQSTPDAPPLANAFADPSTPLPAAPTIASSGRYAVYCVRPCDGRYFPISTRGTSAALTCQAFCPASTTKVFAGSTIERAVTTAGERYPDMANAFAYRKALKADCTCNGRDPAGLAPSDLSLDTTLRPGDIVATTRGLVAYTGVHIGNDRTAEFTPVAHYPGLTADLRARLGEMKVALVSATIPDEFGPAEIDVTGALSNAALAPPIAAPKIISAAAKRAAAK